MFLTAHQQHALRAFDAEALDYLLKPVDPERFERSLERAKEQIGLRRQRSPHEESRPFLKRLVVQKSGREIFLATQRLDWADADGNYVHLHAGAERTPFAVPSSTCPGNWTPIIRADQSFSL